MKQFAVIVSSHGEVETPRFSAYRDQIRHIFHHASAYMHIPKLAMNIIPVFGGAMMLMKHKTTGYISPYNAITRKQAEKLREHLSALVSNAPFTLDVLTTFETTPPYTEEAMAEAMQKYHGVIVLVMNPIDGELSCGTLCKFALKEFSAQELAKLTVLGGLWRDEELAQTYCEHIIEQAQRVKIEGKAGLALIMHGTVLARKDGTPVSFRNGLKETEAFYARLHALLSADKRHHFSEIAVGYLNHAVGGKWTTPTFKETVEHFKKRGVETMMAFASGYFADSSETQHAAEDMLKAGFKQAYYIPCVNASDAFASYLARRVSRAAHALLKRQEMYEPHVKQETAKLSSYPR